MSDAAGSVNDALIESLSTANGAPAVVAPVASGSAWTAAQLLADLAGPPAPSVAAVFAHADHTALETPQGDTMLADDLATALPDGARLVFSMGCHTGLAVSDAVVGSGAAADDLAAAIAGDGAVYVAATGYGYGDEFSVGLQERLMTLFAGELDGAVSVGDALRNAKQAYFAGQGLYGSYDEKALSSTILYGLPMFAVGTERPVRPVPENAERRPGRPDSRDCSRATTTRSFTLRRPQRSGRALVRGRHRNRPAVAADHRRSPDPAARRDSTSPPQRRTTRCSRPTERWSACSTPTASSATSTPPSAGR